MGEMISSSLASCSCDKDRFSSTFRVEDVQRENKQLVENRLRCEPSQMISVLPRGVQWGMPFCFILFWERGGRETERKREREREDERRERRREGESQNYLLLDVHLWKFYQEETTFTSHIYFILKRDVGKWNQSERQRLRRKIRKERVIRGNGREYWWAKHTMLF